MWGDECGGEVPVSRVDVVAIGRNWGEHLI